MGRSAELTQRHWRTHLLTAYGEIADRPAFFDELEAEAERRHACRPRRRTARRGHRPPCTTRSLGPITLMELQEPPDPRRSQLIPVVSYAVERRLASGQADYWDYATRLELAVHAKDEGAARRALSTSTALAMGRETWEPKSTASNLALIRDAREHHGDDVPWAERIERELLGKAGISRCDRG